MGGKFYWCYQVQESHEKVREFQVRDIERTNRKRKKKSLVSNGPIDID